MAVFVVQRIRDLAQERTADDVLGSSVVALDETEAPNETARLSLDELKAWIVAGGLVSGVINKTLLSGVVDLTGGGGTKLDGQNATAANVGELWEVFVTQGGGGLQTWRVEAGTAATNVDGEPPVVRAANYATTTNEVVFVRRR